MGAPTTPEQLIVARRDWRAVLERDYTGVSKRLQAAYRRFLNQAQPLLDDLNNDIADIYKATGQIRPEDVRGIPVYRRLVNLIEIELSDFAVISRNLSGEVVEQAIVTGSNAAQNLTLAEAGRFAPQLDGVFVKPSPEALARMIQFADSEAFRTKWSTFGENAARQFGDMLLIGVAQGRNPQYIARLIRNWLGVPYNWAENTTRTAMLNGYRYANHLTYSANPRILEGWYWIASLSPRTCVSCWNQHGTLHGLDETLNDHHRGRCTPMPAIIGIEQDVVNGRGAFEQLPEAQQRAIFKNNALYDAWKDGQVRWDDLSVPYTDEIYGDMLRPPTAKGLGL